MPLPPTAHYQNIRDEISRIGSDRSEESRERSGQREAGTEAAARLDHVLLSLSLECAYDMVMSLTAAGWKRHVRMLSVLYADATLTLLLCLAFTASIYLSVHTH